MGRYTLQRGDLEAFSILVSSISSQRLRTKADRSIKIKIRRNSRFLAQFKVIDCKEVTWEKPDGGKNYFGHEISE